MKAGSSTTINKIYCKYALTGYDLTLKKNVLLEVDRYGKIAHIKCNVEVPKNKEFMNFKHHLLIPKFINSHIHLGDALLKDQALNLNLNEAVGTDGLKFQVYLSKKSTRISAMRSALVEMIMNGISTCFDFREGGIKGIHELKSALRKLPINIHILGRPDNKDDLEMLFSQGSGIGLSTPILYSKDELVSIRKFAHMKNAWIATHIGEVPQIINDALGLYGYSDLKLALEFLDPDILIHLTATNEEELNIIPTNKFLVFCPRSNAYFGLGMPPLPHFLFKNYLFGLGSDNVMVTPPNMLEELRWILLRLREKRISIPPSYALKFITTNPAKALKLSTGCIKKNFWADLLIVDLQSHRMKFSCDPVSALIFRSQFPEDISLNLFQGKVISNGFN